MLQLNRRKIPGTETRIFSEKASREMWTQQTVIAVNEQGPEEPRPTRAHLSGYGLGWFLRDYKARKLVGHSGGVP